MSSRPLRLHPHAAAVSPPALSVEVLLRLKTRLGWVLLCSDLVISNHPRRETPGLVGQLIVIGHIHGHDYISLQSSLDVE